MKTKYGIIGGAGPYASALLYHKIVKQHYGSGLGALPELILINFPFTRGLTKSESQSNHETLIEEVQGCIESLASQGVSRFTISCNTLHHYLDHVDYQGMKPFHIPEMVLSQAKQEGLKTLLVLSTETTKQKGLYEDESMELVYPNSTEQQLINQVIDRILCGKICKEDAIILKNLVIEINKRKEIDGVILGCTDLPVLHASFPIAVPGIHTLDSIDITAKAFLQAFEMEVSS